ncbi:hypothetical protein ACFL6U_28915 [Planctomycetota bacterium]
MGRPPKKAKDRKAKVLTLRLTAEELKQLTSDAKEMEMTRTEYVRYCWQKERNSDGRGTKEAAQIRKISRLVQELRRQTDILSGDK